MKIIDAHVHLVQYIAGTGAGGELRYSGNGMAEYASGERFQMLPEEFSQGVVTPEDILGKMDENGVEKAVLLQGNYFGFQNLYSLQAAARYPKRFRASFLSPSSSLSSSFMDTASRWQTTNFMPGCPVMAFLSRSTCQLSL